MYMYVNVVLSWYIFTVVDEDGYTLSSEWLKLALWHAQSGKQE